jgi:hypothetical protein
VPTAGLLAANEARNIACAAIGEMNLVQIRRHRQYWFIASDRSGVKIC